MKRCQSKSLSSFAIEKVSFLMVDFSFDCQSRNANLLKGIQNILTMVVFLVQLMQVAWSELRVVVKNEREVVQSLSGSGLRP